MLLECPESLTEFVRHNLTDLLHLDLSYNQFMKTPNDLTPLLMNLRPSVSLESLNLSHTPLPNLKHYDCIQYLILNNKCLKHIDLSFTQLKNPVELMKQIVTNDVSL